MGNIKHTHARSHAGLHLGAQSHLTGLICGPPTSLSLPHSSTALTRAISHSFAHSFPSFSLSAAHTDARDSAATGEAIAPHRCNVTERGRAPPSDLPPAHATPAQTLLPCSRARFPPRNVQRKRTLQLNESNPSGIEAIIEAAGTVFCLFFSPSSPPLPRSLRPLLG